MKCRNCSISIDKLRKSLCPSCFKISKDIQKELMKWHEVGGVDPQSYEKGNFIEDD